MKNSPIKLNSSSKAKLKVTKSPSRCNEESRLLCDDSRIRSSVHTIPIKQSPSRPRNLKSNFTEDQIDYACSQSYNQEVLLRSGSPANKHKIPKDLSASGKMKASKSFANLVTNNNHFEHHVMVSPQKQKLYHTVVHNQTLPHIMSPSKSTFNQRSFIRVQKSPVKVLAPTTRFVSPPQKIVQQIHYKVSPRQVQLQRKVKILEARVGELHTQKTQTEIHMNQMNMRLQCQNTFLKEKLNSYSSNQQTQRQRSQSAQKGLLLVSKKISSIHEKDNEVACRNCQRQSNTLSHSNSQKLIKDLEKSQQNEYHQSKQIYALKQQLLQTQEMLSKQINKSLQLLQELALKQNENQNLKTQIKVYRDKIGKMEQQLQDFSTSNQKLVKLQETKLSLQNQIHNLKTSLNESYGYTQNLQNQIQGLKAQDRQMLITKDLLNDLEQNNQLLIQAIRKLEASVRQSQKQITQLSNQKHELESKIAQLQHEAHESSKTLRQKQNHYQNEIQNLASKLIDIESELLEKNTQIQEMNAFIQEKERTLQEKNTVLKSQQNRIQVLLKSNEQGNSSTANSFYKNMNKDPCTKCDDLRKTIIKLNSHLNKSIGFTNDPRRTY